MADDGRPRRFHLLFALVMAVLVVVPAIPARAEENAEFASVVLSVSPPVQGIGGTVTVRLTANFYGGCCYSLFAYDVAPNLSVPEGLEVVSGPVPGGIGKFEAPQGGLLAPAVFTYTLKSLTVGKYSLNATVATKNCGSQTVRSTVEYIKGAIFSGPKVLYPATVSVGERSVFSVEAYSGLEGVAVESVEMRCAVLAAGTPVQGLTADDGGLLRPGGLKGTGAILQRDPEEPTIWRGSVPPPDRTGVLAVWLLALDSTGNTTVSSVFTFRVADTPAVYRTVQAAPLAAIAVFALGIAGIFIAWRQRFGMVMLPEESGLGLLGQRRDTGQGGARRPSARLALQVAAVAAAVLLVAWAVAQGLFTLMTGYTGGA